MLLTTLPSTVKGLQLTFDTTGYATGNGTIHTDAPGNAS